MQSKKKSRAKPRQQSVEQGQRFPNPRTAFRLADSSVNGTIRRLVNGPQTLVASAGLSVKNTDVSSAANWSNVSGGYKELRVLAIRIYWLPNSTTPAYLVASTEHTGVATAPANVTNAWQYAGSRIYNVNSTSAAPRSLTAYVRDPEEFDFDPVGALSARFSILAFNSSAATVNYFTEFICEFRGAI